jgi:hypothetical protein
MARTRREEGSLVLPMLCIYTQNPPIKDGKYCNEYIFSPATPISGYFHNCGSRIYITYLDNFTLQDARNWLDNPWPPSAIHLETLDVRISKEILAGVRVPVVCAHCKTPEGYHKLMISTEVNLIPRADMAD